jgi:hypothetical protein
MPRKLVPKRIVHFNGVYFGAGRLFSSPEREQRSYSLLLGDDYWHAVEDKYTQDRRPWAAARLATIFTFALERVPTLAALEADLGWQVVAGDLVCQIRVVYALIWQSRWSLCS